MGTIFLIAGLSCPVVQIVNYTNKWLEIDKKSLQMAQKRCAIYYPEAPCLKKFIKKEEQVYWAICGTA